MDYRKLTIEELRELAQTDPKACWEMLDRETEEEEEETEDQDPYPNDEPEEEPTQVWFTEAPCGHYGYE